MNFCPNCGFMLYTKISEGSANLLNYCKNCSWEGEYINPSQNKKISVYRKNYNTDFLADKVLYNQYITEDPTLPRISNIECINSECLTNKKLGLFNFKIGISVEKQQLLTDYLSTNQITPDMYRLHQLNNQIVINFSEEDKFNMLKSLVSQDMLELNDELKVAISKFTNNREIIFMKYDALNLKYMYLCNTCKTTWKND